jgi:bacterioferritin
MGTKAQGIIKISPEEVTAKLNQSLADEWLAAIQYWSGAQVVKGPYKATVEAELRAHFEEELGHADILAKRIIQLGGKPVSSPEAMLKLAGSGYEAPDNPLSAGVVAQNLRGEQHAILAYNDILETVRGKDPITHNLILKILKDEVEHEQDLEDLLETLSCQ